MDLDNDWSRMGKKRKAAYLDNLKNLYGDKVPSDNTVSVDNFTVPALDKKSSTPKLNLPTEDQEQFAVVNYLTRLQVPFYHVPNGGRRSLREGIKFKRLGVKAGVPDICITRARKGCHGLYIELKRQKGGVISDSQLEWADILTREGYAVALAEGAEEAIQIINNYLEIKK